MELTRKRNEHLVRSQARKDLEAVVPFQVRKEARIAYLRSKMQEAKEAWAKEADQQAAWASKWSQEPDWLKELASDTSKARLEALKRSYDRAKGELDNLANDRKPEITDDMLEAARSAPIDLFVDEVKRRGSLGLAICPFHQDTKPSMTIFDDGHYHCFVCQAHGDAIELLMRRDGLKWKQAVKTVLTTIGYVLV